MTNDINRYYVYALIDPETKAFFYIGKGSGKRYKVHLTSSNSKTNTLKEKKIKEIRAKKLEVNVEILFSNLTEETSFFIEKKLIYLLGRQIIGEGILTNIVPGGKRKPGDSLFYEKDELKELNSPLKIIKEHYQKFAPIFNHDYLNTKKSDQLIYRYDCNGNFQTSESLNTFFKGAFFERELSIFNALKKNNFPIYTSNVIYSKFHLEEVLISKNKFYRDLEPINQLKCNKYDLDYENLYKFEKEKSNKDWEAYINHIKNQ